MRPFFLSLTALFVSVYSQAQSAEDSVKNVVNTLFTAMRNVDPEMLKGTFHESAVLQAFGRSKDGKMEVRTEKVADFATSISSAKKDSLDERIVFETIKIDGPMALVWTPYKFYYNGKFSHCGVNSFQLVRLNGVWKIQYLIDTRRKSGCSDAVK